MVEKNTFRRNIGDFYKSRNGGILFFVMMLCAFLVMLGGLFFKTIQNDSKYRNQVQVNAEQKIEAFSFLDLALSFLSECKEKEKLPEYNPSTKIPNMNPVGDNSQKDKLIFDKKILGGKPESSLVSDYITSCIYSSLNSKGIPIALNPENLDKLKGYAHDISDPNLKKKLCLKHNGFTIEYNFEDLSGKLPLLSKSQYSSLKDLYVKVLQKSHPSISATNTKNFFSALKGNNTSVNWNFIASQFSISINNTKKIEDMKTCFTLENFVNKEAEIKDENRKFKLNLLFSDDTICDAIDLLNPVDNSLGSPGTPAPLNSTGAGGSKIKTKDLKSLPENICAHFIKNCTLTGNIRLKDFFTTEVTCFSVQVRVSVDNGTSANSGSSFSLICYCSTKENEKAAVDQRLPFRVVRIEEI